MESLPRPVMHPIISTCSFTPHSAIVRFLYLSICLVVCVSLVSVSISVLYMQSNTCTRAEALWLDQRAMPQTAKRACNWHEITKHLLRGRSSQRCSRLLGNALAPWKDNACQMTGHERLWL